MSAVTPLDIPTPAGGNLREEAGLHADATPAPGPPITPARSFRITFSRARLLVLDGILLLATAVVASQVLHERSTEPLAFAGMSLLTLLARGEYGPQGYRTRLDAFFSLAIALGMGAVLANAFATFIGHGGADLPVLLATWLAATVVVPLGRGALKAAKRVGVVMPDEPMRVLIVGTGKVGRQVAQRLVEHPEWKMVPVGFLDIDEQSPARLEGPALPYLGHPRDVAEVVARTRATQVIMAFTAARDAELMAMLRRCEELSLDVAVVPRFYDSVGRRAQIGHVGGLPMLVLGGADRLRWRLAVKAVTDRAVAAVALVALAPVLACIALAVRLTSPGPSLFRQERVGQNGRVFELLKFRSMAPASATTTFQAAPGLAPGGIEEADRRTRLGAWLRRTAIDELPQLINVARGDMSLVGPRPERPEYVERFGGELDRYHERHRMKPGMTGWSQIHGLRGQTSIAERAEWDNFYIENFSLRLDLKILLLTILAVLKTPADA